MAQLDTLRSNMSNSLIHWPRFAGLWFVWHAGFKFASSTESLGAGYTEVSTQDMFVVEIFAHSALLINHRWGC